ncbi:NAD(P)-binding protein [Dyella telluris]|uniref:NAD(P)-binding protein n=1 Tax=Dyella telluris TaxID=2763498 RepID=UPI001C9AE6A1|nr:NAD(P)-binding protein [Dyella telluris]
MSTQPRRIAILGGGVGAMTAAFWLTNREGWQNDYQIDVYQMGWRLGGKGASGRNAERAERIEEHGLHIWFGFYDNAFQLMQQAYGELGRPPGSPLATWDEAFKKHRLVCLTEAIDDAWRVWSILTPLLPGEPGAPRDVASIGAAHAGLLERVSGWVDEWALVAGRPMGGVNASTVMAGDVALSDPSVIAATASDLAALDADASAPIYADTILALLKWLQEKLHEAGAWLQAFGLWFDDVRRLYLCLDLALAVGIGMLADDVLGKGFEAINHVDFCDWLASHGAQPASVRSAPVMGFYDLVFAYRDGDAERPEIEAGTMLRGMLKVGLGYRGAIMYKMQAGMGDVVFAPLHELLERRGVRFHYFHKLLALQPDADGKLVQQVALQEQVSLRDGIASYQPLKDVKGLPCWPSAPLYEQLEPAQADLLKRSDANLECHWSDWPQCYEQAFQRPLPLKVLQRGVDFDDIVFGLSVGSLPVVAPALLERSPALRDCSDHVKAVATQAYQVWTRRDLTGLGWQCAVADGEEPVLSGFTEPFDTWASMNQLLCRETWPPGDEPLGVSYFCNAFAVRDYPDSDHHDFPERCAEQVKASAIHQLDHDIRALWTHVGAGGFDWNWLVDPENGEGVARFNRQYWRANVDPSERYVQSLVNTSNYRLRADQSGFANLFLAGDWLKTGLDAGCVEAAVMGGMQASRAISGFPATIQGESGW